MEGNAGTFSCIKEYSMLQRESNFRALIMRSGRQSNGGFRISKSAVRNLYKYKTKIIEHGVNLIDAVNYDWNEGHICGRLTNVELKVADDGELELYGSFAYHADKNEFDYKKTVCDYQISYSSDRILNDTIIDFALCSCSLKTDSSK